MISPEAVKWAKPIISQILGVPVQDAEVESILAMEEDEAICRHLAAFSENPTAYIQATDFVQNYRKTFAHGAKVQSPMAAQPRKVKVTYKKTATQVTYKNEDDMDNLFQESLLEGMMIQAPRSVMGGSAKSSLERKVCGCMGHDHDLSRNCISCGRVMCILEATDAACVACGFGANQKIDKKIFQEYKESPGYEEAVEIMRRLLAFDKDGAARTRVYDTHTDFYEEKNNPWCTESERELSAAYSQRQDAVYEDPTKLLANNACLEIDLDNMKLSMSDVQQEFVNSQNDALKKYLDNERHNLHESASRVEKSVQARDSVSTRLPHDDDDWILEQTQVVTSGDSKLIRSGNNWQPVTRQPIDVIDNDEDDACSSEGPKPELDTDFVTSDIKHTQDRGICLTLHQPWASLIVYGLKRIEGRIWTTDFRGRLWIHAASTEPSTDQIVQMESYYNNIYANPKTRPRFPPNYPTRCLLGCVDLVDITSSHKGLWDQYPWIVEVNDSPFKWILKNPQRLVTPIPMPGEHKLWQLHKVSVYHRALRTSEYYKVIPAHIDNQDPLTVNRDIIDRVMAGSEHGSTGVQAGADVPWKVRERYSLLRAEVLGSIDVNSISITTRKPKNISTSIVELCGALESKALSSFCSALILSIERAFIDDSSWTSSIGDPNRKIRDHFESLWSHEDVYASIKIHPAIRDVVETLLSQGSDQRKFSLGGPHIPPVDILELYLRPSTSQDSGEAKQDETILYGSVGEPIILIGIAGTHVLGFGLASELFIGAGDVIIVHKNTSLKKLALNRAFLSDVDEPLLAECALCILRCNIVLA